MIKYIKKLFAKKQKEAPQEVNKISSPMEQEKNQPRSFTLQFFSIEDLIRKTERLKAAHKIQSETMIETLRQNAIHYTKIGEYDVGIDIRFLSKDKLDFIKQQNSTFLNSVYEELNVIKNYGQPADTRHYARKNSIKKIKP